MIKNKQFTIITIFLILISFYSNLILSEDESYYFKGDFGTSSLTINKSNSIRGVADVLIKRVDGTYTFSYTITLTSIDGTDIFQSRIMGPSAPNKDEGSLKLTLSYSTNVATKFTFVGKGSQSLAFNSPSSSLIAPILMGLTTSPEKSNYENEQFYVVINTATDGTSPVTRAQLKYVGATNLPKPGGGDNPNGSSEDALPTATPLPSSSEPTSQPINSTSSTAESTTEDSNSSATQSSSPSSSSISDDPTSLSSTSDNTTSTSTTKPSSPNESSASSILNPGGAEISTGSSKQGDTSDSNSVLPTIFIVSLFVLSLVIMS